MVGEIKPGTYFWSGNDAIAEGAIFAGCRFFAGYPITPSNEISERLSWRLPQVGGIFVQMEDEIASIATIIGASWGGLKAMTATSGPGFSLMQENIGLAVMMEVPIVIANIQRAGPSTGLPTMIGMGDVQQARWGTHGPHEIIALAPSTVQEAFDLTIKAFNLAEKFRTPVILLADEGLSHMYERVNVPDPRDVIIINRKMAKDPRNYLPYRADSDLIPPMAPVGEGFRIQSTGLTHDERGYPAINAEAQNKLIKRLIDKIQKRKHEIIDYELYRGDDAEIIVISYGSAARSAKSAVDMAREENIKAGFLKLRTIWPFPDELIYSLAKKVKAFIVAEINEGQITREVERASKGQAEVFWVGNYGGRWIYPEEILDKILEVR